MDNVEYVKKGSLIIDGESEKWEKELVFFLTDEYGYTGTYKAPIKLNEQMNSVQAAANDLCDRLAIVPCIWAESDEDKAELKEIIYAKALEIKDKVDTRDFI